MRDLDQAAHAPDSRLLLVFIGLFFSWIHSLAGPVAAAVSTTHTARAVLLKDSVILELSFLGLQNCALRCAGVYSQAHRHAHTSGSFCLGPLLSPCSLCASMESISSMDNMTESMEIYKDEPGGIVGSTQGSKTS